MIESLFSTGRRFYQQKENLLKKKRAPVHHWNPNEEFWRKPNLYISYIKKPLVTH